ncbi:hypothetical protein M422DRAFT_197125, partial [Sphaerobolus stellatus SS14]
MNVKCQKCGALHWLDERSSSKGSKANPQFGICCLYGRVQLPATSQPPEHLLSLFTAQTAEGKAFRQHIRQYNAAFAFTSLGCKLNERMLQGQPGVYSFRIDGELYHSHGSLLPDEDGSARYAQLYFFDPVLALDQRMSNNQGTDRRVMARIQTILQQCNPFIRIYQTARQILDTGADKADFSVRIHFDPTVDQRRYNAPTANEIAAVLPGSGDERHDGRDIILRLRGGGLRRIKYGSPGYIPLHYTLLYP